LDENQVENGIEPSASSDEGRPSFWSLCWRRSRRRKTLSFMGCCWAPISANGTTDASQLCVYMLDDR
jgi:hypothetical protein